MPDVRPMRSLWLLTLAHAVNHAQAALLPLVYIVVIDDFHIDVPTIAFLAALGSFASGAVQLTYSGMTRRVSRRAILGVGNIIFGTFMALQAAASSFIPFAAANITSRIGGSPQHPVGNGLLAEQFPAKRLGFAISAHIAGGNVGSAFVPLIGAALIAGIGWRNTVILFGLPAMVIGVAMLLLVRESGS
ncbi:MAG: MFS transporter, partial [Candidatus Limnocylindrales bacterium]